MKDLSIVETLFPNIASALVLNKFSIQRGKHATKPRGNGIWNSQKLAFSGSIPNCLHLNEKVHVSHSFGLSRRHWPLLTGY